MRVVVACAVMLLTTAAAAKDLIAPTSERQLDERIALFQQEARLAACDSHDRICAMGKRKLAGAAVRLAMRYPECMDDACKARKSKRNADATAVANTIDAASGVSAEPDLYREHITTGRLPDPAASEAYVSGVEQSLASSNCLENEKVCAVGRLAYLVEIDQLVRLRFTACEQIGVANGPDARQACAGKLGTQTAAADVLGRKGLESIVDRFGWPDAVRWGDEAQNDAWLLAQHADEDRALQKKFLKLIKASFEQGYTPAESYAYIADRQLSANHKPQLYGTQGRCYGEGVERVWKPNPIADEAHIDQRRKAADMEPYAEYRKATDQMCRGRL